MFGLLSQRERGVRVKIAIIGAGVSAAAAAAALVAQGAAVTVFEKARGPGGRISSKRALAGSFDFGAQYFTARNEAFQQKVQQWQQQGVVQVWPLLPYQYAKGVLQPSADNETRYIGAATMHQMLAGEFAGVSMHYGCKINELSYIRSNVSSHSQGHWQLCSEQGECFGGFDALLLTCPPEQARQLLEGTVLSLRIPEQALLPCWAVLLELATPTHHPADAIFVRDGKTRWIAKQSAKPGRHSARLQENLQQAPEQWLLHLSAEASAAELETMPEQISALAAAELSQVLGTEVKVAAALCHRWLYASYNDKVQPCGVLFDPQLQLALCGDWTLGGRVENAWLSGGQAALQFLQQQLPPHCSQK